MTQNWAGCCTPNLTIRILAAEVTVECEGLPACKAKPLVITSHAAPRPKLLERYEKTEPARSRLLDAAEKNHIRRQEVVPMYEDFRFESDSKEFLLGSAGRDGV